MTMPIMMIEVIRKCLGDSIRNPPVRIRIKTIKHQAPAIKIQHHRKQRIKLTLIVLGDWSLSIVLCDQSNTHRRGQANECGQSQADQTH